MISASLHDSIEVIRKYKCYGAQLRVTSYNLIVSIKKRFGVIRRMYTHEEIASLGLKFSDWLDHTLSDMAEELDRDLGEMED